MNSPDANQQRTSLRNVCICGLIVLLAFVAIFALSGSFEYGSKQTRPILAVTGILIAAAVAAFVALGQAIKVGLSEKRKLLLVIVSIALSARLVALFTCPILEIDYYRYLWDGKVSAQGVSPYRYSPAQVLGVRGEETSAELQSLMKLSDVSQSNHTILSRVHFPQYTSLYPPVSQFVFALTMKWFPDTASVDAHLCLIRFVLVLFDVGTMLLVYWLLCLVKTHPGWLIAYAWNPLVVKEIANGGHLDSIAAFFLILAVFAIVGWQLSRRKGNTWLAVCGGALGLGVGAKLAPIVIFPALVALVARRSWSQALLLATVFLMVSAIVMSPMLGTVERSGASKDGLVGFLSKWRMNDPIFSTVYLNFKNRAWPENGKPWFVVTSKDWRDRWFGGSEPGAEDTAFLTTRLLTLGGFGCFYLWQLFAIYFRGRTREATLGLSDSAATQASALMFLTRLVWVMALFLVVQPTVNPWYFVWLAPLTCLSRNRGWLIVAGALLIYYSRFWFGSLDDGYEVWGEHYAGVGLYDHLVVFVEFSIAVIGMVYFGIRSDQNGS